LLLGKEIIPKKRRGGVKRKRKREKKISLQAYNE